MAKKLTVELDVQNQRAKKAAEDVGKAAAEGIERAASASDRLAGNLEKASGGLSVSSKQLAAVAAGMGGMILGTAAKAIALKTEDGSTAQKAIGYGGAALQGMGQGAAMGSMFGPWGTAIGSLVGLLNGLANKFLDDETNEKNRRDQLRKTNEANREMVGSLLAAQKRTEEFQRTVDSLGDKEKSLTVRQNELADEIKKREREERRLKDVMQEKSAQGATEADQKELGQALKAYQTNGAELSRLRSMQKALEGEGPAKAAAAYRAGFGGTDAITKLGGAFAGGGVDLGRDQLKVANDQLTVLKSIEAKTGNGGSTWQ